MKAAAKTYGEKLALQRNQLRNGSQLSGVAGVYLAAKAGAA